MDEQAVEQKQGVEASAAASLAQKIAANLQARHPRAGRDSRVRRALPALRGPSDHRGLPGRGEDGPSPSHSRGRWTARSPAFSSRRTCCRPTSPGSTSSTSGRTSSSSGPGRSSPTSCSSTRSTAPRRRPRLPCSSACRSARSRSTASLTSSRRRSWSWPRRTRSSTRAPTRCPRPSSTGSPCGSRSATHRSPTRRGCSPRTRPRRRSTRWSAWRAHRRF